jgi:hypothetical protein
MSENKRRLCGSGIFRVTPKNEFFNRIDPLRTFAFLQRSRSDFWGAAETMSIQNGIGVPSQDSTVDFSS